MLKEIIFSTVAVLSSAAALAQAGPYERELDAKIYDAINANDWRKAQELAVTARQKQMVADAKRRADPIANVKEMSSSEQFNRGQEQRILIREAQAAAARDYLNKR